MKKLTSIILLITFILVLAACQDRDDPRKHVPPNISGTGDITYFIGDPLPDYREGVSAYDLTDGDLTDAIIIDDSDVDYETAGVYPLVYRVTDSDGNTVTKTVNVIVIESSGGTTSPPVILGATNHTHVSGQAPPDYLAGVVAFDANEGYLTDLIILDDSAVDYETPGTYPVTMTVSNTTGGQAVVTISVTVIEPMAGIDHLDIYYLNDLHGFIMEEGNRMGMARVGNLILDAFDQKPDNTLFISGGDMLQGTLLSNHFHGESVIDLLNMMHHDAFVIGNHEFDWGLEQVTRYFNPAYEGTQAQFPLLGANVYFKGTTTIPDFIEPYTVIERAGVRIGIIGLMGYGLESSIADAMVRDYEFGNPVPVVEHYAEHLRMTEDVQVILVAIHGADGSFNQAVGNLTGNQRVDAVFNGHSHQTYVQFHSRSGVNMPIMQSGGYGSAVGHLRLDLNHDGQVTGYLAQNLNGGNEARLNIAHPVIETRLDDIIEAVEASLGKPIFEPILIAGQSLSRGDLTVYMAKLIRLSSDSDIAFHNYGGTRISISNGAGISLNTVHQVFPFDNRIKTTYLSGATIKDLLTQNYYQNHDIRPGVIFEDDTYYKVATNDYVFDYPAGVFIHGIDSEDTGIFMRDLFIAVLENQRDAGYTHFYLSTPIVLQVPIWIDRFLIKDEKAYRYET